MESSRPTTATDGSAALFFVLALVAAVVMLAVGVVLAINGRGYEVVTVGGAALILVLVTWPISLSIAGWRRSAEAERATMSASVADRLHQITTLLSTLSERQLLSDRAKAVAYRDKDRQALRSAIRADIVAKDWDAALVLANDMENEFGYGQEATALRAEINENRSEVVRQQVTDARAVIDQHVRAERWTLALREAERIMRVFPTDEQVMHLPEEIEARRQTLKRQLREGLEEAIARNDSEGGIAILKKLDPYLMPAEAATMQEMARGLFRERLNLLKDRFTTAYRAKDITETIRVGEFIMHEHTNSRLAVEVRDMMDSLRQQVTQAAVA